MPRTARVAPGGMVFHVINRANARARIFGKDADYAAFERVMQETLAKKPMRILGYLIMPNHVLCEASHNIGTLYFGRNGTAIWPSSCSG